MPNRENEGSIGSRPPPPVLEGLGVGEGEPLWPCVWLGLGLGLVDDGDGLAELDAPAVLVFLVVCPFPGVAPFPPLPAATLDGVVPGDAEGFVVGATRCALGGTIGVCCSAVGVT
jgi:hypothetical protein